MSVVVRPMSGHEPDHWGLLFGGRAHLVDVVLPTLVAGLEGGNAVVVTLERELAAPLRAILGPSSRSGTISFLDPDALPAPGSPGFLAWSGAVAPTARRVVLLRRYRAGCGAGGRALPPGLTLLCACPTDAPADVLLDFRRRHPLLPRPTAQDTTAQDAAPGPRPGPPAPRPGSPRGRSEPSPGRGARPVGAATFAGLADLADLRPLLRRAAGAAGFGPDARECAVLAVHEAAVVACRLIRGEHDGGVGTGGVGTGGVGAGRSHDGGDGAPCTVEARAARGQLVVDIDLPRAVAFPPALRDDDPFRYARLFSRSVAFSGTLRTRMLRIESRAEVGWPAV